MLPRILAQSQGRFVVYIRRSPNINTDVCLIDYSIDERTVVSRRIVIHHWPLIYGRGIVNQLDPHLSLPHLPPLIVLLTL